MRVKCTNLCRVLKTKYLAVSPVTDNFEQLDLELLEDLSHPNFIIKLDG